MWNFKLLKTLIYKKFKEKTYEIQRYKNYLLIYI